MTDCDGDIAGSVPGPIKMAGTPTWERAHDARRRGMPRTVSTLYWPDRSAWMAEVDVLRRSELIVPPRSVGALIEALQWALSPSQQDAVRAIATRAKATALTRFDPDHYVASVMGAVRDAVRRCSGVR
jgi:hypothetical protein